MNDSVYSKKTEVWPGPNQPPAPQPPHQPPAPQKPVSQSNAPAPSAASKTVVLRRKEVDRYAFLVSIKGAQYGQTLPIDPSEPTTIGRSAQCDIVLDQDSVSSQHAKIRPETSGADETVFYLFDLATTNGTKVNEEAIYRHKLQENDRIQIGETILIYKEVNTKGEK